MNRGDAYKLLAARLNTLRSEGYDSLLARVDQPARSDTVQLNGDPVIVTTAISWADRKHGRLRVSVTADGPSTWMMERLEESFIIAPPSANSVRSAADGQATVVGLTVDQYDYLITSGVLPENTQTELIDRLIVRKDRSHLGCEPVTVGAGHAFTISRLTDLSSAIRAAGAMIRIQQPIVIPPFHEPEPDASIVHARADDYVTAHPNASDVFCVIEVSDSSLQYDRTTKLATYAQAAIPCYIILNLPEHKVEIFTKPVTRGAYSVVEELSIDAMLRIPTGDGKGIEVPVERLIPRI